jgi:hypothetical protein
MGHFDNADAFKAALEQRDLFWRVAPVGLRVVDETERKRKRQAAHASCGAR